MPVGQDAAGKGGYDATGLSDGRDDAGLCGVAGDVERQERDGEVV